MDIRQGMNEVALRVSDGDSEKPLVLTDVELAVFRQSKDGEASR
jgi:hypothetical protein